MTERLIRRTNRSTDRHRERETKRQKERQTDKMLKVGPRTRYHTNDRLDKKTDDILSIKLFFRS